jgi:hypothetical protein
MNTLCPELQVCIFEYIVGPFVAECNNYSANKPESLDIKIKNYASVIDMWHDRRRHLTTQFRAIVGPWRLTCRLFAAIASKYHPMSDRMLRPFNIKLSRHRTGALYAVPKKSCFALIYPDDQIRIYYETKYRQIFSLKIRRLVSDPYYMKIKVLREQLYSGNLTIIRVLQEHEYVQDDIVKQEPTCYRKYLRRALRLINIIGKSMPKEYTKFHSVGGHGREWLIKMIDGTDLE